MEGSFANIIKDGALFAKMAKGWRVLSRIEESGGSFWQNCHLLPLPKQNRGEGGGARHRRQSGALRDGGGRGWGQEREGTEGVRFPLLPRAGVEQGGLATRISGGSARRL